MQTVWNVEYSETPTSIHSKRDGTIKSSLSTVYTRTKIPKSSVALKRFQPIKLDKAGGSDHFGATLTIKKLSDRALLSSWEGMC